MIGLNVSTYSKGIGKQVVHAQPIRDRAIVYLLLSAGRRREEVIRLDLDQVESHTPGALRTMLKAKIIHVKGEGKTECTVFLSANVRNALGDYLVRDRDRDATAGQTALFLMA